MRTILLEMVSRWSLTLCALFALGCALGFGYSHVTRPQPPAAGPASLPPASHDSTTASPEIAGEASDRQDSAAAQSDEMVREDSGASAQQGMLVLANGTASDPAGWLAAIDALARERPLQAISVLQQRLDVIGDADDPHFIAQVRHMLAQLQQRHPEGD